MRKIVSALLVTLMSSGAYAEMVAGVSISRLSDDDLSFGLLQGAVGYRFEVSEDFSLIPEARVGLGIGDDSIGGVDIDLDSAYGVAVRGQFDFDSSYVWVAPSYSKVQLSGSGFGISVTADSDWEFGGGLGYGYRLNENMAFEVSYEGVDGAALIGVGARFNF